MGGTSYLDLLTPLSLSVYWCILNIMFIAPKTPPWNHLLPFPSIDSDTLHYYNMASIRLFTTWMELISVLTNKSLSHFTSWCSLGRKLIHYGLENIRNASIIRLKHQKFVPELTLKVPLVSGLFRRVKVNDLWNPHSFASMRENYFRKRVHWCWMRLSYVWTIKSYRMEMGAYCFSFNCFHRTLVLRKLNIKGMLLP